MPHPAPGPGAAPGSIAAARRPLGRPRDDPEPVSRPQVHALGALEDVPGAGAGEHEAARSNRSHRPDDELAIQQDGRDREAHPERVDRTGAVEQERVVGTHRRTAAPTAHPLAMRLGRLGSEDMAARTEKTHLAHRTTVVPGGDIVDGRSDRWGGQDSNPRHEG
jgi:hypothetical protein